MPADQVGGFALTAGAFGVLVFALLRIYLRSEAGRDTLLDRYQHDLVIRDARIERLEDEVVSLRVALDECNRRHLATD